MKGFFTALALTLTLPWAAHAQPDTALTLNTVLDRVERDHPLLLAAARERAVAEGELTAAEGSFDPSTRIRGSITPLGYYNLSLADAQITQPTTLHGLSFFAGYRLGRSTYTGFPTYDSRETNELGEVRAGVSLPILRNGPIDRARANIQRAELGRSLATLSVAQQRLELARAATVRYWEWVAAGRRLAVSRTLLSLAQDRDAGLAARVERGDLPSFERTDNQRAVAQREALVVSAQRGVEQAAIELSLYLRDAAGSTELPSAQALPADLPEPPTLQAACVARVTAEAPRRRPEGQRFEALSAQQEVERRWASNQRLPQLDLSVGASQDLGDGAQSRRDPVLDVALTVELPLRNRVANGRLRAAEAAQARAEDQARFARDRIGADVTDARSALRAAVERVGITRRESGLAQELASLERRRFEAGDSTLLFVNLREQAAAEASFRVIDALLDAQRALAAWSFATATDVRDRTASCVE